MTSLHEVRQVGSVSFVSEMRRVLPGRATMEAPVVRRAARRRRRHGSRARVEEESIAAKGSRHLLSENPFLPLQILHPCSPTNPSTMSRQAQKGAAAAAMRNQLKVDAARVKAAAARKDAAQLPEQRSSCKAMHLPEQLRPARRRACGWMWRS